MKSTPTQPQLIDVKDPEVLRDGVRMLKSQFVELYEKLGYSQGDASSAWHIIRTSPKGQEMMNQLYKKGDTNKVATFITETGMDDEVKERLKAKVKNKNKQLAQVQAEEETQKVLPSVEEEGDLFEDKVVVEDEVLNIPDAEVPEPEPKKKGKKAAAPKAEKPAKEKKEKKPAKAEKPAAAPKKKNDDGRGDKTRVAKEMIASGNKDVKEISEKSGAAIAYVRTLMYQMRQKAKK